MATRFQTLCQAADHCLLGRLVEVNHHIPAKNYGEGAELRQALHKVHAREFDGRADMRLDAVKAVGLP
jgi:hypothetical protein